VFEPGTPADVTGGPWTEVLEAGAAFARALADLERPWFTTIRTDRWAIADRVAWQEESVDVPAEYGHLAGRLADLAGDRPADAAQVVHGDLSGNVLLHPDLDPLILDFSPYWRPVPYALSVVVTDALCWHGAQPGLLTAARDFLGEQPLGYLARSLIFRVVTAGLWAVEHGRPTDDLPHFARVSDQLTALADAG
jgi:Ser/Thr protein kinase RdoA (MazF antagonist)